MKSEIKNSIRNVSGGAADAARCAGTVRKRVGDIPKIAIVLGSGFGGVVDAMVSIIEVPYSRLPGFLKPGVAGHSGKLITGKLAGQSILVLSGRSHCYEGHSMAAITFPIRVLAELGVEILILTNASGGINGKFRTGDFMLIKDHINFMGENPLRGPAMEGRERFIDMTGAYDKQLRQLTAKAARKCNVSLHKGVYLAVSGPSYETPAEIKAFAKLGADAVGMSTVPEAIVARQCGLRVLGLSCITNSAAGTSKKSISHGEVLEIGKLASERATALVQSILREIRDRW